MPLKTMEEMAGYLKKIKFKRKIVGGIDEDDVWAVMEKLQKEYRSIIDTAEQRNLGLISEREQLIRKQQIEIERLKAVLGQNSHSTTVGNIHE